MFKLNLLFFFFFETFEKIFLSFFFNNAKLLYPCKGENLDGAIEKQVSNHEL